MPHQHRTRSSHKEGKPAREGRLRPGGLGLETIVTLISAGSIASGEIPLEYLLNTRKIPHPRLGAREGPVPKKDPSVGRQIKR